MPKTSDATMNVLNLSPLLLISLAACGAEAEGGGATKSASTAGNAPSEVAQSATASVGSFSGPKMQFVDKVVDFGEVWDTDDMVGKFPFKNTGSETLVISEIKPSCGCTTTELAKMRYEPGEEDAIELVWDPIGFGQQAKKITVRSNSEGAPIEQLTIQARIKPFVTFEPQPVSFETMEYGKSNTRTVFMKCVDQNFELLGLTPAHRNLTAEHVGRRADGALEIQLTFDEQTPWGQMNCSVRAQVRGSVRAGEDPIEHEAVLNINAEVFGDLRAKPTLFLVGHVLPGRTFEKRSVLTHAKGLPFNVVSARVLNSQPPGMKVRTEALGPGGQGGYQLIVSGDAGDYQGLIRAQVSFITDIPGESEHQLAVMGIVRP